VPLTVLQLIAKVGETLDTFIDKVIAGTVPGVHELLRDHSAQRAVKVVISMMQNPCGDELNKMAELCRLLRT
jgi:hypothetical protein